MPYFVDAVGLALRRCLAFLWHRYVELLFSPYAIVLKQKRREQREAEAALPPEERRHRQNQLTLYLLGLELRRPPSYPILPEQFTRNVYKPK